MERPTEIHPPRLKTIRGVENRKTRQNGTTNHGKCLRFCQSILNMFGFKHFYRIFLQFVKEKGKEVRLDPLEGLRHSLGSVINVIVFGKSWSRDDETWKWLQHLQEEGTKHIGVAGPLNFLSFLM